MNFLALIPIFSTLIDRLFPDKEKADAAKLELQKAMNDAYAKEMEAKSKVIVAEAESQSYSARNWRPHLMYMLMCTVSYSIIISPLLKAFGLDIPTYNIPNEAWTLLTVGLGGYIGKDMVTSYTTAKFNDKKFFDTLRGTLGGIDQNTVDNLNKALEEAKK